MKKERTKRTPDGKVYRYTMSDDAIEKEKSAKRRWYMENYDRLTVDVPKGMLRQVKEAAERRGISKRKFIIDALENAMKEEGVSD